MPRYAQLADGTRLEFPDDTPDEVMVETVRKMIAAGVGKKPEAPDIGAGDRFVQGVVSQLDPIAAVKGIGSAVMSPKETMRGQLRAMDEQWEKAALARNLPEQIARGVAGSVPLVGPAAAQIGERIGTSEDKATALGEGVGLVAAAGIPLAAARGGKAALQTANKIRAPFAAELDPVVAAAQARSGRGIDLPAGAVSTAKPVQTMEALAMKGFGGGRAAERYTAATAELTARANQLVERASRYGSESERGLAVAEGFKAYRQAWIRTKNALYNDAMRSLPDFQTPMPETFAEVMRIIQEKHAAGRVAQAGPAADASFYQGLFNGLTREVLGPDGKPTGTRTLREIPVSDLMAFRREFNAKLKSAYAEPFAAGNKGQLLRLKAIMQKELDAALASASPEFAQKLEAADRVYQGGLARINSTFGKTIDRLAKAGKYDDISKAVANAQMSVDDIPRLKQVAGAEGTQAIQASVLADLIARGTKNGRLTPQGLRVALERFDRAAPGALDTLLEPSQSRTLRDISTMSQSLEKGIRAAEGSQTAFLGRISALGGALVTSPRMGLKLLLGDLGFNKFISSAAGQKWMKQGYQPIGSPWFTSDVPGAAVGSMVVTPQATGSGYATQPVPAR